MTNYENSILIKTGLRKWFEDRFLLLDHHASIISDEQFMLVQKTMQSRSKSHEMGFDIDLTLC